MIGTLRGSLLDRGEGDVTVEVGGVGYRVVVTPTTAVSLGDVGHEVFCWIHHHQREDAVTLYGFASKDERSSFEALLGAHGVGPALALAILSVHSPIALARVVAEDDVGALCLVPGVGKKTAQRLLIELKGALDIPELDDASLPDQPGPRVAPGARADVRDALVGLGYAPDEIRTVLRDLPGSTDASELLKLALQRLAMAG